MANGLNGGGPGTRSTGDQSAGGAVNGAPVDGSIRESVVVYDAQPASGPGSVPARRWPPETIDAAYRLWVGVADRDCAQVQRLLSAEQSVTVPGNTIRDWVHRYDWNRRRVTESLDTVQTEADRLADRLWVAAPQAVNLLRDTITGHADPTDKQLKAAIHIETAARSLLLKQADLSNRDGRRKPQPRISTPPVDYASLSPDELEQLERQRRTGRGSAV